MLHFRAKLKDRNENFGHLPGQVSAEGHGESLWLGSALLGTLLTAQMDIVPWGTWSRSIPASCQVSLTPGSMFLVPSSLEPAHGSPAPVLFSSAPLQPLSSREGSVLPGTSLLCPLLYMRRRPRKSWITNAIFPWLPFSWLSKQFYTSFS